MSQGPKHFTIQSDRHGETIFVRLCGEFDVACQDHFDRTIDELVQEARTLIIDLSDLQFIDSSGLRALLRVRERVAAGGHDLAVVTGNGQVRHAIELTGLDGVLPIVAEPPAGTRATSSS
jgi:anti-anti-sigma factor